MSGASEAPAPPSAAAKVFAVLFMVGVLGASVWLNVYTGLRWAEQAAIESGPTVTGRLVRSDVYRDVRGWGREFVGYTYEAPGPDGAMKTYEGFRHIDAGVVTGEPEPGAEIAVRYVADEPELSNLDGNSAQLMSWLLACLAVDAVFAWAIFMAVRGARENA